MGSQIGGNHYLAVTGAERMQHPIAQAEQHQGQSGLLRCRFDLLQQTGHLQMQTFLPHHALQQQLRPIVPRQLGTQCQQQRKQQQRPQAEDPVPFTRGGLAEIY